MAWLCCLLAASSIQQDTPTREMRRRYSLRTSNETPFLPSRFSFFQLHGWLLCGLGYAVWYPNQAKEKRTETKSSSQNGTMTTRKVSFQSRVCSQTVISLLTYEYDQYLFVGSTVGSWIWWIRVNSREFIFTVVKTVKTRWKPWKLWKPFSRAWIHFHCVKGMRYGVTTPRSFFTQVKTIHHSMLYMNSVQYKKSKFKL